MYKYDWGVVFTFSVCLALAAVGLWDYQQQHKSGTLCEYTANGVECRRQQFLSERAGMPQSLERTISNPEPRSGADHEKRDLAAQEASAVWALWMVVVSAIGTLVAIIGTIMLYIQLKLTRAAVEHAGETNAAVLRIEDARITISVPEIHTSDTQGKYNIRYILNNIGRTAAIIHTVKLNSQEMHVNEALTPDGESLRYESLPQSLNREGQNEYIDIIIEYTSLLSNRMKLKARAIVADYPMGALKFGSIESQNVEAITGPRST